MTSPGTWKQIDCLDREALIDRIGRSYNGFSRESGVGVLSSVTDMYGGVTGRPYVMTEWGYDYDRPVLRDERWPNSDRKCEHHQWVTGD